MRFQNVFAFIATSVCALLVTASCSSTRVHYPVGRRVGNGPPPHAPAHGYRRKQVHGVEVVFDSHLGVYVVVGHPGHYYYDGYFYRLKGGVWQVSLRFDGGWAVKSEKLLPPGLRAKAKGKSRNNSNAIAKGRGKHKGR